MSGRRVLLLDDDSGLRAKLVRVLRDESFEVIEAYGIAEAREKLETLWQSGDQLDVGVLDMRLEPSTTTGAEYGIEIRERQREWPPEFIIQSAYDDPEYYQYAIGLGAATYFRKPYDYEDLVRHVRALCLRRALDVGKPGLTDQLQSLAEASDSPGRVLDRFCEEVLTRALSESIRSRFLLLLTEGGITRRLGSPLDLPGISPIYDFLQPLIHGRLAATGVDGRLVQSPPVLFNGALFPEPLRGELTGGAYSPLNQAAFIPLSDGVTCRLSLGILQESRRGRDLPEQAERLAVVVGAYLRPTLVNHLVEVTRAWAETEAARAAAEAKRRQTVEATGSFCTYVGQEVEILANSARRSVDTPAGAKPELGRLLALAEELIDAGSLLQEVMPGNLGLAASDGTLATQDVEMGELVRVVWSTLVSRGQVREPDALQVTGSCTVRRRPGHLEIAVSRVLQWFAQRLIEAPKEVRPALFVSCRDAEWGSEVTFEDRGKPLRKELRARLFEPFSDAFLEEAGKTAGRGRHLGMYIARTLVEAEPGGVLADCTDDDDTKGGVGNRLVMRFQRQISAADTRHA